MNYVGRIFRPPSEHASLLLQVTVGCSHNRCAYCDMYRDKQFRPKAADLISADIAEAKAAGPVFRRVFLCDGDAFILPTRKLLKLLEEIRRELPWVERVGSYGDTRSVLRKSVAELTELREAGLGIIYHGMETGHDEVMKRIDKGGTAAEVAETGDRLKAAGITHSVIVLLGIGGLELSAEHASETATLLTRIDPQYVGALTTTVVPNTPLAAAEASGEFVLPDRWQMLGELRDIVRDVRLTDCRFSANHASNYLPLTGTFPADQPAILGLLEQAIELRDDSLLKPEYLRGL
ncbi:MAG: radical SAM superfamily enzyme YgiQ (UPF0313 family) [Myxococcota bacterium]|jgi:radical SAM superfamily enzyme YgiQ (UPF0313 family)